MKRMILTLLATVFVFILLSGCQKTEDGIIFESNEVSVREVNTLEHRQLADFEWLSISMEETYKMHPIIVKGTVTNVREAEVKYKYRDVEKTDYVTLFDFHVSEYLYNSSSSIKKSKDILTIGHSFSSRLTSTEIPVLAEGKEFLLFCIVPSERDVDDPQCIEKYADCWVHSPAQLMLEKVNNQYIMSSYWGQILDASSRITKQENLTSRVDVVLSERMGVSSDDPAFSRSGYIYDCDKMEKLIQGEVVKYTEEES